MTLRTEVRRTLLVLATALLPCAPAGAAGGWAEAVKRPEGSVHIERSSVRREADDVRFVARVDLAEAGRLGGTGRAFRSVVVEGRARCDVRQITTTRTADYDLPGARAEKLAELATPAAARHYVPVPPGASSERIMFDFVCKPPSRE
jgi:hypothetical protein